MAGVIRVVGEDGQGTIDLFGQDGAGELMGQGDGAEGEDETGAGLGGGRPPVGGTDSEDEGLGAGIAETAEVGGEVLAGKLLAAAVEEDENGRGAGGLAVEAGEEVGFGGVVLRLARDVAGGSGEVVGGERGGGI